jgi:TonB-dependent starch-binding outer membrane protein SusC
MKVMEKSFTTKLWKGMKICGVQGMIAIAICGATLAHPNYAQVMDKEISIQLIDIPFENALKEIEQVAKIKFAYSFNQLQDEPNISLSIEKKSLREVFEELLTPRNIAYKVYEKEATITLKKAGDRSKASPHEDTNKKKQERALLDITGTVIDASLQTPMAGVNVIVKGSTNGTTTDADGKYALYAEDKDVLVFSFIGYTSIEMSVSGRSVIDIALQEDSKSLNEVVVNAGYWQVNEKEQTGNISRLIAEEIMRQPINNPLQAIQGRMAGVFVQQNSGVPGGGFKIQIRGQNSLREDGNDPLYIVDGVPFTPNSLTSAIGNSVVMKGNPLASINPADIESIEVLKDADATAVYGSRGANGVVLITTKRGQSGKTIFDLNVATGVGQVASKLNLLNTPQHVQMRKEALVNDGFWPLPSSLYPVVPDVFLWDTTQYTNWQEQLIGKTANTTNVQASVSGGNDNTKFSLGAGYYNESTVFPGDFNFNRVSGSINVSHVSNNKKFLISSILNYSSTVNNLVPVDLTSIATTLPPNAPSLYLEDGTINWDWQNSSVINPLTYTLKKYKSATSNFISNISLAYEVIPGLKVKTSTGFTNMDVKELSTSPTRSIPPQFLGNQTGSSNFGNGDVKTWIIEPQISYDKKLGSGSLTVLIGTTLQQSTQENVTLTARGFSSDALLENIKAATNVQVSTASFYDYRYAGLFGRANYSLSEKYILNMTARRDGSSRFGANNHFGTFGAMGAAWIFSNENLIKDNLIWLSFGKIRGSYGLTGNDAIGNYQYLSTYSPTTYPYNGSAGLSITRLSNPDYSWETNRKFEVGLDLGFIKDRVFLSTSLYINRSANQLVGRPLPVLTGQSTVQFNLPATVENTGIEMLLRTTNIKSKNFAWTSNINFTVPKNVLIEFPNLESYPAYRTQYQVGKSVFIKPTLKSLGVDTQTGLYTFEDVNKDGSISTSDDVGFLKEVSQEFFGGFNNSFSYKGFQVDLFVQFVKQTGYNYLSSYTSPGSFSNQLDIVTSRWQNSGDISEIQRYSLSGQANTAYSYQRFSDRAISDASFIRLKNISISWSLPSRWIDTTLIQNCRFYMLGQNLYTWTNYLGLDPETQNVNFLPPLRMVSFGLNLTL